jgi:GNAT superfamily N-acetyltransferase
MITYEWSDWRHGWFWWIQSVFVRPEHRRTGIIRALFDHIRKIARRQNVCGLRLYVHKANKAAIKTYAALGMSRANYDLYQLEFRAPKRRDEVRRREVAGPPR